MPLDYTHPEFGFKSLREWDEVATPKPDALQLLCPQTSTLVTFAMDVVEQSTGDLLPLARAVLAARKAAYIAAARQGPEAEAQVVIGSELIEPHVSALAYVASFEGMRQKHNFVGYMAIVTRRKVLHVLVETRLSFAPGRREMFREVVAGITPSLP